jgi:hypothetical protein
MAKNLTSRRTSELDHRKPIPTTMEMVLEKFAAGIPGYDTSMPETQDQAVQCELRGVVATVDQKQRCARTDS